jgi:hypothetical protein
VKVRFESGQPFGEGQLDTRWMTAVPRIGDRVLLGEGLWKVYDLVWTLDKNDPVDVVLYVEH